MATAGMRTHPFPRDTSTSKVTACRSYPPKKTSPILAHGYAVPCFLTEPPEFDHPLVIDLLQVNSDKPRQIDLPLYFKGHLIESSPNIVAKQTLRPLGESDGYQHLWRLGETESKQAEFSFTWLQQGRFYTYKAHANVDMQALFTRVGAGDPEFSLRPEQGLLLRAQRAQEFTLVAVLEPHGRV